jgi:type I restriction enzyme, R subunit
MTNSEADTCRKFVVPKLQAAGWDNEPHSIAEQRSVTDGRIVPVGKGFIRKPPKRVDYLLRYARDFVLAVIEAKASYKTAADAVQQARAYAEMLGLKFAYATNGVDIIEIDYFTGTETRISDYPTPIALWQRYQQGSGITEPARTEQLLAPYNTLGGKPPRYYQQIAINRTVESLLNGKRRLLGAHVGIARPSIESRASSTLPTGTFWLMTRRTRPSRHSAMRVTKSNPANHS